MQQNGCSRAYEELQWRKHYRCVALHSLIPLCSQKSGCTSTSPAALKVSIHAASPFWVVSTECQESRILFTPEFEKVRRTFVGGLVSCLPRSQCSTERETGEVGPGLLAGTTPVLGGGARLTHSPPDHQAAPALVRNTPDLGGLGGCVG